MFLRWDETLILAMLFSFVAGAFFSHTKTWLALRRGKSPDPPSAGLPPISIIKPVRGLDQEAEENFLSFIQSEYPAPFEVLFCVEGRDDPAVPLIQRLIADTRDPAKARLIFSKRQDRREMGKTVNLMAGIMESSYDHLVLSDSDVRNTPGFLEELVQPLARSGVGLAYACPVYRGARDWVAGLMALAVNESILALATAPPFTAIGSSMATRKDVLRAIGGLAPMRHRLGIDAALGRSVRAKGYAICLIKQPVTIVHPRATFGEWWRQLHRWLVTIRRHIGGKYFAVLFYGFPIPFAALYFLLASYRGRSLPGLAILASILLLRLLSLALVNLFFAKEPTLWRYLWLVPVLEFLKIPLWLAGYLNPYVVWRGRKYRVMPDATVRPAD